MPENLRKPAVAGSFYPGTRDSLKAALDNIMEFQLQKTTPVDGLNGMVVPHAGYMYSGKTAAMAYSMLKGSRAGRFVIIGPNHSSFPFYSAVYPSGQWNTPLGNVAVDEKLCRAIADSNQGARIDPSAHNHEHSVEVQIPFLQYMMGNDILISPIIMGSQGAGEAHKMAQALLKMEDDFIIIASSDLNHYENLEITKRKDKLLLDAILDLDIAMFYNVLKEHEISACGYGPIAVLMEYTMEKNGKLGLLGHSTSYDYSGDSNNVVGYAAIKASR